VQRIPFKITDQGEAPPEDLEIIDDGVWMGDNFEVEHPDGVAWVRVVAGQDHALAIDSEGQLWGWGGNGFGQLGLGDTDERPIPVQITGHNTWTDISAGVRFSVGVRNGQVYTWGDNSVGQLGRGGGTLVPSLVSSFSLSPIERVSAGGSHTLALNGDGEVYSWGLNSSGQLGVGNYSSSSAPQQVSGLWDIIDISAGGSHSLASGQAGEVFAWGLNNHGQLGFGGSIPGSNSNVPDTILSLYDTGAISAGVLNSAAISSSSLLYTWGRDNYSQLGHGDYTDKSEPTQVGVLTGWTRVALHADHSLGIRNGALFAWGRDQFGQLGQGGAGPSFNRSTPSQIGSASDWVEVATGGSYTVGSGGDGFSLAIRDGRLYTWGLNSSGQLGHGDYTNRSIPVKIGEG
jgi:alpha-tubulin suppressor-like RCC1 family protein